MEKLAWQEFLTFCDTAITNELLEKRGRILDLIPKLQDEDVIRDAHRMVKTIDQELMGRVL